MATIVGEYCFRESPTFARVFETLFLCFLDIVDARRGDLLRVRVRLRVTEVGMIV